jgi:thiol-disulfide isomerase/thioredoxin
MNQYLKAIIGTGAGILIIFVIFYFFGISFVSNISPTIEVSSTNTENTSGAIVVGKKPPVFDLASSSGIRINSFENEGKASVIFFWSTWNTASTDQIRIIDDYLIDNKKNNESLPIRIIAINSQESQATATNFINRGGYDVPVAFDTTGEISNLYAIKTLPTIFFVNRQGILVESYVGVINKQALVDKIEKIIK